MIIRKMALVTIMVVFLYIVIDSQNSINVALSLRYSFEEVTMLWRTVRSMDVMMHSSSFLLPKLHRPVNRPVKNYALVVLNQHLPRFMPRLWDHANLRICADGGANRIFDEMFQLTNDEDEISIRNRYIPEIIEGDMDSIRPEVKLFYSSQVLLLEFSFYMVYLVILFKFLHCSQFVPDVKLDVTRKN